MASADGNNGDGGNRSVLAQGVRYLGLIVQALQTAFPQVTSLAATATAGAGTLPAKPVGFIVISLPDGSTAKIPYYLE